MPASPPRRRSPTPTSTPTPCRTPPSTAAPRTTRSAEDDDRELALLALEEGDATTAMFLWAFGNLAPDELGGIGADAPARHERHPGLDGPAARVPVPVRRRFVGQPVRLRRLGRRGRRLRRAAGLDRAGAASREVHLTARRPVGRPAILDVASVDAERLDGSPSRAPWARRGWRSGWSGHGRLASRDADGGGGRLGRRPADGGDRRRTASWGLALADRMGHTGRGRRVREAYGELKADAAVRDAAGPRLGSGDDRPARLVG